MITLRCTRKLQKYLKVVPTDVLQLTTATLGDWYANLVPTFSGDLTILVNEKSLLSVAIPSGPASNLASLLRMRVANLLGMIGIDPKLVRSEISHLEQIQYGNTASRRILGSMNDIALQYQDMAEEAVSGIDPSLSKAELFLSRMPSKILRYRFPYEIAEELLGARKRDAS